ncbi:tyrosine-protein phosphatase 10D-like isoform X2 [Ostrea edulis]|uniref:tyrosine-protein phosphatase 10D-like isoform X2 n=1 Tax=Ostrea edulis TaxID=37623 RepID=UPI00209591FB|nr:tyrosine-protein phosphatase 10D-like isoform X2 [Ostrea edulis]
MFYLAICVWLNIFVHLTLSQESLHIDTSDHDLTVNITSANDSHQYRFGYGTENLTWIELSGGDSFTYLHYTAINLNPGATYVVKVEKSNVEIFSQQATTNPLPPVRVHVTAAGTNFMTISWETDTKSIQDGGEVFLSPNSSQVLKFTAVSGKEVNATNLQPGMQYSITVVTLSNGKSSKRSEAKIDNTVPLAPMLTSVQAVDTKTLMVAWTTQEEQDEFFLTATYNDTRNVQQTKKLMCRMVIRLCLVDAPGIPGQKLLIQGYTRKGQRQSAPYSTFHSTKPETVLGLLDNSSSTSHLHLTILPPFYSYFNNYNIEVFRVNGSEQTFDQNLPLNNEETDIFLWNLTAGTLYNFSVTTRTIWEESDIYSTEFVTYPNSPQNLQLTEVTNSTVTLTWTTVTSGGLDYYQSTITPREINTMSPVQQDNLQLRQVTFSNLVPGKNYTVGVRAAKQKKLSPQIIAEFLTVPNPPEMVNITAISGRELDVDWSPPASGIVDYYTVYLTSDHTHQINVTEKVYISYYRFTSLHPGETYTVHIRSHVANMMSSEVTLSAMTNPSSVAELYVDYVGISTVNISWPRPNGSTFDTFEIAIDPLHTQSPITIPNSSDILQYTFTNLTPGQLYKISITTVNQGIQSDRATVQVITEPLPVEDLNVTSGDPNTLNVEWRTVDPKQQHYFILLYHDWLDSGNTSLPMVLALHDQYKYETHILNLKPGHHYSVYVQAKQIRDTGNSSLVAYSAWQSVNKTTKPDKVMNLTYTASQDDIVLTWLPENDSLQDSYFVWYRARLHSTYSQWKKNVSNDTQIKLSSLFPGLLYEMVVFAVSHSEMSPPSVVSALMPPLPPSDVLVAGISNDSISLNWTYSSNTTFVESWILTYISLIDGAANTVKILANSSDLSVNYTITGLTSGHPYNVSIYSTVQKSVSKSVHLIVYVRPEIDAVLSEGSVGSKNITVLYTETDNYYEFYEFELIPSSEVVKKNRNDTNLSVMFSGLEGGTKYSIKVTAVSGNQYSQSKVIQIRTEPEIPYVEREKTANYIKLTIHKPPGNVELYNVTCTDNCGFQTKPANQTKVVLEFGPLNPYTNYQFVIQAIAGDKRSLLFISSRTEEAAPSSVQNLNVVEISPRTVNVSWSPPRNPNGIIRSYHIVYTAEDEIGHFMDQGQMDITVTSELIIAQTIRRKFTSLKAGLKYTFKVSASTVIENVPKRFEIVLRTYNPPIKDSLTLSQTKPKQLTSGGQTVSPTTITANFTNAFSDKYGKIQAYTVILATDPDEEHIKTSTLPDWKAAHVNPNVKAYQTIRNCSDFFMPTSSCGQARSTRSTGARSYKLFDIGVETYCNNVLFCNGPLKQNTKYYVRLRAYTAGGYADTAYSDPIITGVVNDQDDSASAGVIVAAVLCSVFVVVLIIAIFVIYRRLQRKSPERHSGTTTPRASFSRQKKSHEFRVADFKEYIKILSADSDFKYAEQFEDLKEVGRDQSCSAAELPVNRGKNRFTNILPYDHSRVKLLPTDDEEGSDYINANYMPGFTSKREYIVTQGPLPSTRDDFWRMIWEQNVRNIVMLTRCTEKGREKCDHYWPMNSDAMFYGDLQVAVLTETRFPSWSITEMRIAYGNVTRPIRHFHFTAWPDFGVPERPQTLIKFVRSVRDHLIRECGPILVHCRDHGLQLPEKDVLVTIMANDDQQSSDLRGKPQYT